MVQTRTLTGAAMQAAALDPETQLGTVTLKVADLRRSLAFYTELIGLRPIGQAASTALLGAGRRPILALEELPGARPQPPNTTGLYHAAILLPDRRSLAVKAAQMANAGLRLGQADHLVSEAFYLSDPDGNGLELYWDRPRSDWGWTGGQVRMAVDPIDLDSLFAEFRDADKELADPAMPDGTRLGHMHLRVADLVLAGDFYHGVLGFDVTARMPGALFLSAGGYHHHIGVNTWESRGAKPPAEPSAGLREFSIALPDQVALGRLAEQIQAAGVAVEAGENNSFVVLDPFRNRVRVHTRQRFTVSY